MTTKIPIIPLADKLPSTPGPWDIGTCSINEPMPDHVVTGFDHMVFLGEYLAKHPEALKQAVRYEANTPAQALKTFHEMWDHFAAFMTQRGMETDPMCVEDLVQIAARMEAYGCAHTYLETDEEDLKITFFIRNREHGKPQSN